MNRYTLALKDGGELYEGEPDVSAEADLRIVNDVVGRIDDMVSKLKWA
jgi:hypothetical protein